jgi:hypothetical protein
MVDVCTTRSLTACFHRFPETSSAEQTSNLSAGTLAEWRDQNESRVLAARRKGEGEHAHAQYAGANQDSPLSTPGIIAGEGAGGMSSSTADGAGMDLPGRHRHLAGLPPSSPALLTSSIVRSAQDGAVDRLSDGWARLRAKGPGGIVTSTAAVRAQDEVVEPPSSVLNESGEYCKTATLGSQHHSIGSAPSRTMMTMAKPLSSGMTLPALADRAGKRSTPLARSSNSNQRLFVSRTKSTGDSMWEEEEDLSLDPTAPVGMA